MCRVDIILLTHDSFAYQKHGRVRMTIGRETCVIEEGDSYRHPTEIAHWHEVSEDSVRIEINHYPAGNAIEPTREPCTKAERNLFPGK